MAAPALKPSKHCFWTIAELSTWYNQRMLASIKLTDLQHARSREMRFVTLAFHFGLKFVEHWDSRWNFHGVTDPTSPWHGVFGFAETSEINRRIVEEKQDKFDALYDWTVEHERRFHEVERSRAYDTGPGGIQDDRTKQRMEDYKEAWREHPCELNHPMSPRGLQTMMEVYRELKGRDKEAAEIFEDEFVGDKCILWIFKCRSNRYLPEDYFNKNK